MSQHEPAQSMAAPSAKPFLSTGVGVLAGCLFSCLLWGSAFPCIKIGYDLLGIPATDTASQLLFAGMRFTLAGVMVIFATSVANRRPLAPARTDWPAILELCLFQTILQYAFFYLGLSKASGVTSSIIEAMANFMAILFSVYLFHQERLTHRKVIGCALGFAGVVLINVTGSGFAPTFSFDGEGFIFVCTCAGAMSTCLIQKLGRDHDPVMLAGWQFLVGGILLSVAGVAAGGRVVLASGEAVALLAYMGFISAGAYSVWSKLLQVNPVSRVSVFGFMNPVFGFILSAVLLGEGGVIEPWKAVVALVLISVGIVVVNLGPAGTKRADSPASLEDGE